jgi:hypothetical protein
MGVSQHQQGTALSLEERKLEAELALKRRELEARLEADRQRFWYSSPLTLAVASAVFAVLGTWLGAVLQGYNETELERQKFEAALIEKALDTKDQQASARNLLFLLQAGLISDPEGKISALARSPERLPSCAPNLTLFPPSGDGDTVMINGVVVPNEGCPEIKRIEWSWGDGSTTEHWFPATHLYESKGEYDVTVTAYDTGGNSSQKETSVSIGAD